MNLGLLIFGIRVPILLYADDIVLLASSADELQHMLDIVSKYASKWQFRFNTKPGKSNVVITGPRDVSAEQRQFKLGDGTLTCSEQYKYLGIEMGKVQLGKPANDCWSSYFDRIIKKASLASHRLLYSVRGCSPLQIETAVHLFKTLVRPILEYGAGVWGAMVSPVTLKRLDGVQIKFGRALMRLPPKVANEYILRELKLESMEQRTTVAAFNYFGHLCDMDQDRLPAKLFQSRSDLIGRGGTRAELSWCRAVRVKLRSAGFADEAKRLQVDEDWRSQVNEWANQHFLDNSDRDMQRMSSLELFCQLKPSRPGGMLCQTLDHAGAAIRLKLRCGGAPLMEVVGAAAGIDREERTCRMCGENELENAEHFASHCSFYDDLRADCVQRLNAVIGAEIQNDFKSALARYDVNIFLGDSLTSKLPDEVRRPCDTVICNFLRRAWRRRAGKWKTFTVADNAWRLSSD
jgi:hypothetical protein